MKETCENTNDKNMETFPYCIHLVILLFYLVYHLQNYSKIVSCFVILNRSGLRLEPWGIPGCFLIFHVITD